MSTINDCTPVCSTCHTPSQVSTAYGVMFALRHWLKSITNIPWYESHREASQPDQQFGIVEITGAQQNSKGEHRLLDTEEENEKCVIKKYHFYYDVSLKVKNTRVQELNGSEQTSRKVYPLDVMTDIITYYYSFEEVGGALEQSGVVISEFNEIETSVENDDGCCWYDEASMNIRLCVGREMSCVQRVLTEFTLNFCDDVVEQYEKGACE